jgi:carboxylesterase type B
VKGIESVIVTHDSDEATMFVPELVNDRPTAFEDEIQSLYGDSSAAIDMIRSQYPSSKYADTQAQLIDYMNPSYFICNVWNIAKAYQNKVWLGQYSRGTGKHGTDIRVIFFNATAGPPRDDPGLLQFAPMWQDYFLSHAMTGDVNTKRATSAPEWPRAIIGNTYRNVMNANITFQLIEDEELNSNICDFWLKVWKTAKAS